MEFLLFIEDYVRSLVFVMVNCLVIFVGEDIEFISREDELRLGFSLEIGEGRYRGVERF